MKKVTAAALVVTAVAIAPMSAIASSDREEIEAACRQATEDENIEMLDIPDYIADCIATNLAVERRGGGAEEKEETAELMKAEPK